MHRHLHIHICMQYRYMQKYFLLFCVSHHVMCVCLPTMRSGSLCIFMCVILAIMVSFVCMTYVMWQAIKASTKKGPCIATVMLASVANVGRTHQAAHACSQLLTACSRPPMNQLYTSSES